MMLVGEDHPGVSFEGRIDDAAKRARGVQLALGLNIGSSIFSVATLPLEDLAKIADTARNLLYCVTSVLFIRWLWTVVKLARELGSGLQWKPSWALWAFVIPIANLWEPYRLLRGVTQALAPERVPDPLPRVEVDGATGYRGVRLVVAPRRLELPASFVGAWWACYWFGVTAPAIAFGFATALHIGYIDSIVAIQIVAAVLDVVSAVFAILVVRAVAARLAERFRRIRYNPVHVLREAGIEFPAVET